MNPVTCSEKCYNQINEENEAKKVKSLTVKPEEGRTNEPEPLIIEPIIEKEANEFLKFLTHNEYNVVEELHK